MTNQEYQPGITVCVPARNEESGIRYCLESILRQNFKHPMNILVCANGCDDGTEAVVKSVASEHSDKNLELLTTDERGKSNALNILRERARTRYVFYVDGDVVLNPNSLETLYQAFQDSPRHILLGGRAIPNTTDSSWLTRWITIPPTSQKDIYGGFFGIDDEQLSAHLAEKGYTKIPDAIRAEDSWLSLIIPSDRQAVIHGATFQYKPNEWFENKIVLNRYYTAREQLRQEFGNQLQRTQESQIEKLRRKYGAVLEAKSFSDRAYLVSGILAGGVIMGYQRIVARRRARLDSTLGSKSNWGSAPSSKDTRVIFENQFH